MKAVRKGLQRKSGTTKHESEPMSFCDDRDDDDVHRVELFSLCGDNKQTTEKH